MNLGEDKRSSLLSQSVSPRGGGLTAEVCDAKNGIVLKIEASHRYNNNMCRAFDRLRCRLCAAPLSHSGND